MLSCVKQEAVFEKFFLVQLVVVGIVQLLITSGFQHWLFDVLILLSLKWLLDLLLSLQVPRLEQAETS